MQDQLAVALTTGDSYPWTLLARLDPPKPFSDLIESIIAAIWIDSHGSLAACSAFLERLGLLSYLHRVLERGDVALLHPKEELGKRSQSLYETRQRNISPIAATCVR